MGIGIVDCDNCSRPFHMETYGEECAFCGFAYTADKLNGRMVEITHGDMSGFVGRAVDRNEHGWIAVELDATDPEDDRVVYPLCPDDVELRPDLEDRHG